MQEPNYSFWKTKTLWRLVDAASLLSAVEPPEDAKTFDRNIKTGGLPARIYGHLKDSVDTREIEFLPPRDGFYHSTLIKPVDCLTWALQQAWINEGGHSIPAPLLTLLQGIMKPEVNFHLQLPKPKKFYSLIEVRQLTALAKYPTRKCEQDSDDPDNYDIARACAEVEHEKLVLEAIERSEVVPLNPVTFTPDYFGHGEHGKNRVISFSHFKKFALSLGIEIQEAEPPKVVLPRTLTNVRSAPPPSTPKHRYEIIKPDWVRWQRIDVTRLWKAACLAANFEPPMGLTKEIWTEYETESFPRAYHDIWEAVNGDINLCKLEELPYSGRMLWHVHLGGFAQWALEKGFDIPQQMREMAKPYQINLVAEEHPEPDAPAPAQGHSEQVAGDEKPVKWWHKDHGDLLRMANEIAARMHKDKDFISRGKGQGTVSADKIFREIESFINDREKARVKGTNNRPKTIKFSAIKSHLLKLGFKANH